MTTAKNLIGHQFGQWHVVDDAAHLGARKAWMCVCACGTRRSVAAVSLMSGASLSCGCEPRTRPAPSASKVQQEPAYGIWMHMRARCNSPADIKFHLYGGRGIKVCDRWSDYASFKADMGPRPSPSHSIDRIDTNGNYEPENCRWATPTEQGRNRRNNFRVLRSDGVTFASLTEASEVSGVAAFRIRRAAMNGLKLSGFFWEKVA